MQQTKRLLKKTPLFLYLAHWLSVKKIAKAYRKADVLVIDGRQAGFFSIFFQAMVALQIAKSNGQKLSLAFKKAPYFSKQRGGYSWWDYYFKSHGSMEQSPDPHRNTMTIKSARDQKTLATIGARMPRLLAYKTCSEFELKDEIKGEIESFAKDHFAQSPVIGLHYRGTDKVAGDHAEATKVDHAVVQKILEVIEREIGSFVLFVATDEYSFINFIKGFHYKVVYTDSTRSDDGTSVHMGNKTMDPYLKGKEAIIDSYLLSMCDFLLRTDSNLSKASEFLNPELPVLNISRWTYGDLTVLKKKLKKAHRTWKSKGLG